MKKKLKTKNTLEQYSCKHVPQIVVLQFCGFFVDFIHHKSSHSFKSLSLNLNKGFNSYLAELHNQKKDVKEFSLKQMEVM
jgi:hypothetical protein